MGCEVVDGGDRHWCQRLVPGDSVAHRTLPTETNTPRISTANPAHIMPLLDTELMVIDGHPALVPAARFRAYTYAKIAAPKCNDGYVLGLEKPAGLTFLCLSAKPVSFFISFFPEDAILWLMKRMPQAEETTPATGIGESRITLVSMAL